jgi:vacuolar protein sorting-associated protein 13A/C
LVNFSISKIDIELTLKQVHFEGNKKYLKSFGFSLVDIDKSRLSLSELKIMDA